MTARSWKAAKNGTSDITGYTVNSTYTLTHSHMCESMWLHRVIARNQNVSDAILVLDVDVLNCLISFL